MVHYFFPKHALTTVSQNKLASIDLFSCKCYFSFLASPIPKALFDVFLSPEYLLYAALFCMNSA